MNFCKTCSHSKDDHKGMAMICMKQIGENPDQLCDCNWFDDGTVHVLPLDKVHLHQGQQNSD